jgi:hypothetical protein
MFDVKFHKKICFTKKTQKHMLDEKSPKNMFDEKSPKNISLTKNLPKTYA